MPMGTWWVMHLWTAFCRHTDHAPHWQAYCCQPFIAYDLFTLHMERVAAMNDAAQKGFTLIELMIVVAIIGILAAVALPSYSRYVTRAKLPEAFSLLSGMGLSAQQYFQDNRSYVGAGGIGGCPPGVGLANGSSKNFNFSCTNVTATTITMQASGISADLSTITFTLNQNGVRATTSVPSGWTANSGACWVREQGGSCS